MDPGASTARCCFFRRLARLSGVLRAGVSVSRPNAIRGVSPLLSTERITVTCFQRVIIQAQRISADYMVRLSHGHQVPNGQNQNGQGRNAAQCHDNGQVDRHQNLR
jgi:hypothetical protein